MKAWRGHLPGASRLRPASSSPVPFRPTGSAELEARKGGGEVGPPPGPPLPRGVGKSLPTPTAWRGGGASWRTPSPPCSSLTAREAQHARPFRSSWGRSQGNWRRRPPQSRGRKPPVRPPQCQILWLPNCETAAFKETRSGRLPHRKRLGIILLLRREKREEAGREKGREGRKWLRPSQPGGSAPRGAGPLSSWQADRVNCALSVYAGYPRRAGSAG